MQLNCGEIFYSPFLSPLDVHGLVFLILFILSLEHLRHSPCGDGVRLGDRIVCVVSLI